eukprot:338005_1
MTSIVFVLFLAVYLKDTSSSPAITDRSHYYDGGFIPYIIDASVQGDDLIGIQSAIQEYNTKTGLVLFQRTYENNYIKFAADNVNGCASDSVGMRSGETIISINVNACQVPGREKVAAAIHEIGHAIGLFHTQTREDRDDYIIVHWDNMNPAMWSHSYKVNDEATDCLKYDYESIMHYIKTTNFEPSKVAADGTLPITLEAINPPNAPMGLTSHLSTNDIECVNGLYSPCRVTLYSEDNFLGKKHWPFGSSTADYHYYSEDLLTELGVDQVSSMQITADSNVVCGITLEQMDSSDISSPGSISWIEDNLNNDNTQQFSYTLSQLQAVGFNGQISGMEVLSKYYITITMYDGEEFDGSSRVFNKPQQYTANHLNAIGFTDNSISSIKITVSARYGCFLAMYDNGDLTNDQIYIAVDNTNNPGRKTFEYNLETLQTV